MAFISDERLVKTRQSGKIREGRDEREIMESQKSENVGFKVQKKLIAGERKSSKRVGRSKTIDCGGAVCQEQRILDL